MIIKLNKKLNLKNTGDAKAPVKQTKKVTTKKNTK